VRSAADNGVIRIAIVGCFLLLAANSFGQNNKTVLGPSNVPLQQGAEALKAGDGKEGVRLTSIGLSQAQGSRERRTAKSNLCAGYAMLEEYDRALPYCDEVLLEDDKYWRAHSNRALIYIKQRRFAEAHQDLIKGEAVAPKSKTMQAVRKMYLDATNPVSPVVVIDDRRESDIEKAHED
jgi:tetratricopeptide (TPR) repeat protein